MAAFKRASTVGKLKNPVLQFERVVFKMAKAASANAGCLYVTQGRAFGSTYYGKVNAAGKFYPARDCTPEISAEVARIGADPAGESIAYGLKTGNCACCGRHLENQESVERGIGPICFAKFYG
jgi:hypothetical protein